MTFRRADDRIGVPHLWSNELEMFAREVGLAHIAPALGPGSKSADASLYTTLDRFGRVDLFTAVDVLCGLATLPAGAYVGVTLDPHYVLPRAGALIPIATWRRLLGFAGLEILAERSLPITPPDEPTQLRDIWLRRYWRDADLFDQGMAGELRMLLFCRRCAIAPENVRATIEDHLDIAYLRAKRQDVGSRFRQPLALNIHHIQDYLNLLPIIDLLDPATTVPLVREHVDLRPIRRSAILTDLEVRGFAPRLYQSIDELDWTELEGRPLLSASESAITQGHALSRQVVEAAHVAGCPTFLLQHGVWSESWEGAPIGFGSSKILSWGREHAEGFADARVDVAGVSLPRGMTPQERFRPLGSPKFADMLAPGGKDVLTARLGIKRDRFSGVTLVGTNHHWGRHTDVASFIDDLHALAGSRPDELFVIKPHPAEQFYDYETLKDANVLIYDDILALATGCHIARLLRGVDRVISSLSSLLIDASVAGKPVFQYETGNALAYDGIAAAPLADAERLFTEAGAKKALGSATALAARYAEADHDRFFNTFADELDHATLQPSIRAQSLMQVSAFKLIEATALQAQRTALRLADVAALEQSGLFDPPYYAAVVGDLEGLDPIEHFLTIGGWRHLDPRPSFDSAWYRGQLRTPSEMTMLPVLHYIRIGAKRGLSPHILFRDGWYRLHGGDVPAGTTALSHYLTQGETMGISCHPLFDPGYYAATLSVKPRGSLLEYFILYKDDVGGDPSRSFSIAQYLKRSPDLAKPGLNPLLHYLQAGAGERRLRSDLQRL